jgi:hypothetical protein
MWRQRPSARSAAPALARPTQHPDRQAGSEARRVGCVRQTGEGRLVRTRAAGLPAGRQSACADPKDAAPWRSSAKPVGDTSPRTFVHRICQTAEIWWRKVLGMKRRGPACGLGRRTAQARQKSGALVGVDMYRPSATAQAEGAAGTKIAPAHKAPELEPGTNAA